MSDLRPLKRFLQRGEIREICDEVGIGKVQASNIISGRCKNLLFVEKFIERVQKNKAILERVEALSI